MASEIRFGTDGWRGVISRDFTFENVRIVSQVICDYMKKKGLHTRGLVVGYDRRFLSREYAMEVASVAAANGITVFLGDRYAPTPAISWEVRNRAAGGGIVVTASHNPPSYNGIKFKESFGGSALPETTAELEMLLDENSMAAKEPLFIPYDISLGKGDINLVNPVSGYLKAVGQFVDMDRIKGSGIRVAYDPMYGAGAGYLPSILEEAGLDVTEIRGEENPGFGGTSPEPIDRNMEEIMSMVKGGNYDIGLATDGDADRIGAVDEEGLFFNSHRILTLLMKHLIEDRGKKGDVVKTVSGTGMIDCIGAKLGVKVHETPIGFKHICKKMLAGNILLGGEESGGIGITSHLPERDGILAALLLVEIMAVKGKGLKEVLKEVFDEFGSFYYDRTDLEIEGEKMAAVRKSLEGFHPSSISGMKVVSENRMDGAKFVLDDGSWLLIRASGTEPLLRVYAEAFSPSAVSSLLKAGREIAGL